MNRTSLTKNLFLALTASLVVISANATNIPNNQPQNTNSETISTTSSNDNPAYILNKIASSDTSFKNITNQLDLAKKMIDAIRESFPVINNQDKSNEQNTKLAEQVLEDAPKKIEESLKPLLETLSEELQQSCDITDENGNNALMIAINSWSDENKILLLAEHTEYLDHKNKDGDTAISLLEKSMRNHVAKKIVAIKEEREKQNS